MKQKVLFSRLALLALLLVGGNLFNTASADTAYYTLDATDSNVSTKNSAYASEGSVTVDGILWYFAGNGTVHPWRLGGKGIAKQDRLVRTMTAMGSVIEKIDLTVGEASGITVNSLTLVVASDDQYTNTIDEVSGTFKASSTITFEPKSVSEWPVNSYYKFIFNVTVSGSSNKFVQFSKVEFYAPASTDPSITADEYEVAVPATGEDEGLVTITYNNMTFDDEIAEIEYYESDGTTSTTADAYSWLTAMFDANGNIEYVVDANTGAARSAYMKVYALDDDANKVYSELITITQAAAPQSYTLSWTAGNHTEIFVFDAEEDSDPLTSPATVIEGSTIYVSVGADEGYEIDELTVKDAEDNELTLTEVSENYYSFIMPSSNVSITSTAAAIPTYSLASSITSGKHYIITNGSDAAMGGQNKNNRAAVDVDINNSVATVLSGSKVCEFVIYGPDASGYYTIYDANEAGYLYAASSSSNNLKTQATLNDNARWTIVFGEDGKATITAQGTYTHNIMRYNSSSTLFSCYASGQDDIYLYEKDGEATPTESVTVTSAGYATYCSENALDFTNTGITAYVGTISGTALAFTPITKVPANTGMLLVANGETTVNVASASEATTVSNNCLTGVNEATTLTANDYILNVKDGKAGFYKAGSFTALAAHRAYIPALTAGNVKSFYIDLEDAPTGIGSVENVGLTTDGAIYNVAGQRLQKMQKGINIVNGKKILK